MSAGVVASSHSGELEARIDLDAVNDELENRNASAAEVVDWSHRLFGDRIILTSSFGAHAAVMLHLVTREVPNIPVVLIDTGYLFPETYSYVESLRERFGLNLHVFAARLSAAYQENLYGRLWEQGEAGVERYLHINKVEPMQRALDELGAEAWLAGLRSDQTDHRKALRRVEVQNGRYKVHPILNWSEEDMARYIEANDLPVHPLVAQGYRSIGDWHSTLPTAPDQDPRDGRILGKKKECGIHLPLSDEQNASLKSSGL